MAKNWLVTLGVLCNVSLAAGQCCPGYLHGRVTDQYGAPVPKVTVTIHSCRQSGQQDKSVSTRFDGSYSVQGNWSPCEVSFVATGFRSAERHVEVPVDTNVELNVQMTAMDASPDININSAAKPARWDLGGLVQSGFGVTEDRGSFKFLLIGGHAGRILTPNVGSGLLKGNFEYGVEVFPLWQSYTPKFQRANCTLLPLPTNPGQTYVSCSTEYTVGGTFTGVSITPIILRWNLTRGERWMPWIQGAGGLIWTNHKYPAFGVPLPAPGPVTIGPNGEYYLSNDGPSADTSVWNFTPQFGVGTHYFIRPRRSIDVSANAVHISSASLGDKNPGVNASVQLSIGYSWWK